MCIDGVCTPLCDSGKLDCNTPAAPQGDDGCEADLFDDATCGGCNNDCTPTAGTCLQLSNDNFVCECTSNTDCGGGANVCSNGRCQCFMANHCAYGERCVTECLCNGTDNCIEGNGGDGEHVHVCCPSGCANLRNDPMNCGACNNVCPGECSSGQCV